MAALARSLAWLLPLALASGCNGDDDETCEIETDELSVVALVIDSGFDIRAAVDFERGDRRGRGAPLHLCDTDHLTINGSGTTEIAKSSRIEYALTLPADGERHFAFVLDREAQEDRVTFEVDLPPAFEILAPAADEPLLIGEDHLIEWDPPVDGEDILLGLTEDLGGGQCLVTVGDEHAYEERGGVYVPDTGQWTIPADALTTESLDPCAVTYTLTRVARGDYPTSFSRGGRIEARVERYRDVQLLPP